jgi:hypothetical protein
MKIPFRHSKFPKDRHRADKTVPSNIAYLELYTAINNCKDLAEEQVFELQDLLAEKLKSRRELQKHLIMAD